MTSAPVPVIVGGGLAGLTVALRHAPRPVMVLTAGPLGVDAASSWAQGGVAAALGEGDSSRMHAADTLTAGAGLCRDDVVERVTAAAPAAISFLQQLGARFDQAPDGTWRLGLEGAHGKHRIVHADGDGTGAEIMRAVVAAVHACPSIRVVEGTAQRLVLEDGHIAGVVVDIAGTTTTIPTDAVVLATGGVGGLWQHSTNPRGSRGQGLALAARAGAELRDLEMVQFHPTALDVALDPMPLVSEAVRGAGALLVDAAGEPLVADALAARDVVARAVWRHSRHGQAYLDGRGASLPARFPGMARACRAAGLDPDIDLIPVRPAAHYHCGGVTVDAHGRTTVPGLWAAGEVASTGLHGANRLASNSLLEAVVYGGWVADDLSARPTARAKLDLPRHREPQPTRNPATLAAVRQVMTQAVGVERHGDDLAKAESALRALVAEHPEDDDALVALMVAFSAGTRRESRGGHRRADHPHTAPIARHTTLTLRDVLAASPASHQHALAGASA